MALVGVMGTNALHTTLQNAQLPALVLDCANKCDPHRFYPTINNDIKVVTIELLYGFRDVLRALQPDDYKTIIVTPFDYLFNYQDEYENKRILAHCWELLKQHGATTNIQVILTKPTQHCKVIKMGHTVRSQRQQVEQIVSTLKRYGKSLRHEDQLILQKLLTNTYQHFGNISYANTIDTWAVVLLSILIEQEKRGGNVR